MFFYFLGRKWAVVEPIFTVFNFSLLQTYGASSKCAVFFLDAMLFEEWMGWVAIVSDRKSRNALL